MKRATAEVAASIDGRSIPASGDPIPGFEMADSTGNIVSSSGLAAEGPFVLSFFRGKW